MKTAPKHVSLPKKALGPTPHAARQGRLGPIFQQQLASAITDAVIAVTNTERASSRHVAGFLQGLSLGLAYVAPIGMQNLFVIISTLSHSLKQALAVALVVVFWDISLGLACFLGAGALMDALP